ncbi:hypothetical protein TRFO_05733 [Tritrichomonas foetus]|uniref:Uncharacterized protein n=1 Tax=Tritrichomonas foetus TaxID=1144522 RepID=A0A1J4K517_9EUKA|nr:hypothetical protein TRFO_05733 [Tritrichomonas foetus]|eukprot:OHT06074.1 hypothetical protein TRFO_05733 [Tritrichomonas foetus]
MQDINNVFRTTGLAIMTDKQAIYNGTEPIRATPEQFMNACEIAINSNDVNELVGVCFNLAPFISFNFNSFGNEIINYFWTFLIKISPIITGYPIVYGYIEAVTELATKQRKIDVSFLDFLADPNQNNTFLKPIILVALYDSLPNLLVFNNTEYFLPQILDSFEIKDFSHRSTLLLLLSRLNINIQKVDSCPRFADEIWKFVWEASLSTINFSNIPKPLQQLRQLIPDFFDKPHEIISQKFDMLHEQNLFGITRLLPFLNSTYFQNGIDTLLNYVSTVKLISNGLNEAVSDSLECEFIEQAIDILYNTLSKNLQTQFDDASIYLFSLYFPLFEDHYKDAGMILIRAINLAFSSLESNKAILCFAAAQIADQYKVRSKILKNNVLPSILNTIALNDEISLKYATKALITFQNSCHVFTTSILQSYLHKFGLLFQENGNYKIQCIKRYLQVLDHLVSSEDEDIDIIEIIHFTASYIDTNRPTPLDVRAYFLDLCTSIFRSYPNEFEQLSEFAKLTSIALLSPSNLTENDCTNISFGFPIAAKFATFSASFENLEEIQACLLEISKGRIPCNEKNIRVTSYYAAIIAYTKNLPFPIEIIEQYLSSNDDKYQSRALVNLRYIYKTYKNDGTLMKLLNQIVSLTKLSTSVVFVDAAFSLFKKILKSKKNPELVENIYPVCTDLLYSTSQGRIALLEHNFPFNYDHKSFKFYKFLTMYIEKYKTRAIPLINEIIDWLPLVSTRILPKLIKVINNTLNCDVLPADSVAILWVTLMKLLKENWYDTNIANYLLGCTVNLLLYYPTMCNIHDLMSQLDYMWESNDDEMILILPPIYFDIWANTSVPVTGSHFQIFLEKILQEQVDEWSYPLMIKLLIKIISKEENHDFIFDGCLVISHFLLKSENELQDLEFDEEMIETMKISLQTYYQLNVGIKDMICQEYRSYPGKIDKLCQILDSDL